MRELVHDWRQLDAMHRALIAVLPAAAWFAAASMIRLATGA